MIHFPSSDGTSVVGIEMDASGWFGLSQVLAGKVIVMAVIVRLQITSFFKKRSCYWDLKL